MPPRSFSIYQPVRSHSFVDFGLSGGLEGLRWSNVPVADPAQFADSIVDRSPQLNSLCSIKQLRASTFPDQSFTPPCHNDVRVVLNKAMHDGCEATSNHHGTHFTIAALPQKELLNLAKNSTNEWVREWRAGCNNSSSLGLFEVSGTIHLLWTTGSNGQFLMCTPLDVSGALADPSSALNSSLPAFDCSSIPANKCFTHQRISNIETIAADTLPHVYVRRRTKLQLYSVLDTSASSSSSLLSSLTPCLLSSVEFGTDISASAANHHFPGEAAAVASSLGGLKNKLCIWDIERGEVDFYLRAFDNEDSASTWADSIWGHHPRSIFCFSPRCMKMVDLRSAAVSTAIDIGTAGFLPSGRFHGAHSPCDARVPMIFTSCSSTVSSWDLRFLREPVAQFLHHLEHDPPSLIASSIRECNRGSEGHQAISCLSMDVLICSSCFSYPLLHSIKIGDESTPVTIGLPQSIHGLRHAHELHHSSRALHPDGAQSSAATTSGMCLLSNSLPRGIQRVAFFSSLSGDIWLSYASDEGLKVERGTVAGSVSSHVESRGCHGAAASLQPADHELEPNLRRKFADVASEPMLLAPSEFQKWMAFPRTVDEIAVFTGNVIKCKGHITPSILFQLLPSCCLWRLGSSGIWHMITESILLPSSLNAFDILCATEGSPPVEYLPSICSQLHVPPASLASAVDIAFAHHTVSALPLPEPAKSQPILSALKLFGSPVRSTQSHLFQPQVRFKEAKAHTDLSSIRNQSDHRRTQVLSTASAVTVSTAVSKGLLSATSHSAPVIDGISNPQNIFTSRSTIRGASSAARGLKRRSSQGF